MRSSSNEFSPVCELEIVEPQFLPSREEEEELRAGAIKGCRPSRPPCMDRGGPRGDYYGFFLLLSLSRQHPASHANVVVAFSFSPGAYQQQSAPKMQSNLQKLSPDSVGSCPSLLLSGAGGAFFAKPQQIGKQAKRLSAGGRPLVPTPKKSGSGGERGGVLQSHFANGDTKGELWQEGKC